MRICNCPVGTYLTPVGTLNCPESFGQVQKLIFQRADQAAGLGTTNAPSSGTGNNFSDITFLDATTGIIVGSSGCILKSTDTGVNWSIVTSGTTENLVAVHFPSSSVGYIVGSNGIILKSTNAGASWVIQTSGTEESLTDLYFSDVNTGFAVGTTGTILFTSNGGSSWSAQTSGTTENLYAITFGGLTNNYYVVGVNDTVLKTINGGSSWSAVTGFGDGDYYAAAYYDDSVNINIYIAGSEGLIYRTIDGGSNWSLIDSDLTGIISDITFKDVSGTFHGYCVGDSGDISYIANASGTEWTAQSSGTAQYLSSVYTFGADTFAVGSAGAITVTDDYGTTWVDSVIATAAEPTIKSLATWTALIAATDSTKVVVTPFVAGFVPDAGTPREFGSGNEVLNGVPIAFGTNPTKIKLRIYEPTTSILTNLRLLECEDVEVTFINELGYYAHAGTSSIVHGFKVNSFHVSDLVLGGFDGPDYAEVDFSMPPNWSANFTVTAPADHSGLDLNG